MKPAAGTDAVGFSIWGVGPRPGKVLPILQNFSDKTIHAHAYLPARLPDSSRGGGSLFKSGSNFFVWQFPYRGYSPRGGITVEVLS